MPVSAKTGMQRRLKFWRAASAALGVIAVAVCLPPLKAQDFAAKVLLVKGQVSIVEAGYQKALFAGNEIQPQQVIVTGPDSFARFQVADGSTFEVFANSKVVFRENAAEWRHLLNVWLGRVKVFIQHPPGGFNPNNVTSPTAVISVRGTVFDVVVEDDDGTTFVSVDEGVVTVRNLTAAGEPVSLQPGQSIRVFRDQPLARRNPGNYNVFRAMMRAVEDAIYMQVGRPGPGGGPLPRGGVQGDRGKPGTGNGGKGGTTPGSPPAPGAPPPPPGG